MAALITYLYLDDEEPDVVEPYKETVERRTDELTIRHLPPSPYNKQIGVIENHRVGDGFDGLILDLRLDQHPDWSQEPGTDGPREKANYRASTLAQEIRTRAAEDRSGEYPILLWSTDQKLSASYDRDDTSHDLFDLTVVKGELTEPSFAALTGRRMRALVEGYQMIREVRDDVENRTGQFHRFLGLEEAPLFLDERLLERFEHPRLIRPAHEFARFVLKHLLDTPGPLIDRETVAARLGIDLNESQDAGELIDDRFKSAKYSGPFASGWPRWWESRVLDVWSELSGGSTSLRSLPAQDRVAVLEERTGLHGLSAALPLDARHSTRFWTVCQGTGRPLDPRDGFKLNRVRMYPWQDYLYVSIEAAQARPRITAKEIDPLDRSRFETARAARRSAAKR